MAVSAKESTTHPHVIGLELFRNARVMAMNDHMVARSAVGGGEAPTPRPRPRPMGRDVLDLLDDDADAFDFALRELRAELAPASMLERLLVDQIVLSAGRLRASAEAERLGRPTSEWAPLADVAQSSLGAAVERLARWREARPADSPWAPGWRGADLDVGPCGSVSPIDSFADPLGDDEEDVTWVEHDEPLRFPTTGVGADARLEPVDAGWRSRLEFDDHHPNDWPVVRGTRLDAGRVVHLVIDGLTWSDILERHPELAEADIRACLNYAVEQDGPFELEVRA